MASDIELSHESDCPVEHTPSFIWRHSKTNDKWDENRTYRHRALAKIPFSSIFYCSNPLAAALTRKRTSVFFLCLALVGNVSEFWPSQLFRDHRVRESLKLRFTSIGRRDAQAESCTTERAIALLGISRSGIDISVPNRTEHSGSSITVSFDHPVQWDAWHFLTAHGPRANDPVRFSLDAFDGDAWKTVGSSLAVQVSTETVFLHGRFATSESRGARHDFDVLGPTFFGYFAVRFLGDMQAGFL
jgi:hypothetical protein